MADSTWTGAVDSNWSTPGNWTAGVPGPGDTATFTSSPLTVNIDVPVNVGTIALTDFTFPGITTFADLGEPIAPCVFSIAAGNTLNVVPVVLGAGALSKTGGGSLFLHAANSYLGGTTLAQGVLTALNAAAFGFGSVTTAAGTTLDLSGLAVTNDIFASGTVLNGANYSGVLSAEAGGTVTTSAFPLAPAFVADGGIVDGGGTSYATSPVLFTLKGGGTIQNALLNADNLTAEDGTISAAITLGTLTKTTAGTVTLAAANSFGGGTTVLAGKVVAADLAALGVGTVDLGVIAGAFGEVDLGGFAVANAINAQKARIFGGANYAGAVEIPFNGLLEHLAGVILDGTTNVRNGARYVLQGQNTGTVNNEGTVEVDSGAGATPMKTYQGECGSTFAVRTA